MMRFLFLATLFSCASCFAEFRVYQYYVKSAFDKGQDRNGYIVRSSLDPVSYRAYHGGRGNVTIDLLRTWICPSYTGGHKAYCDSPYKLLSRELLQRELLQGQKGPQ